MKNIEIVRNLYKFTKIYSCGEPDFEEGDVFRLIVPLQNKKRSNLSDRQNRILSITFDNQSKQVEDIADSLNISKSTVLREVQEIKKQVDIVYMKKTKEWKLPK